MNYEGHFISDLHLFSRRSHAHLHRTDIFDAAAQANVFVLGGDIFDFKWSTLGSVETTAAAAADWLRELVTPHGGCEFHFILGNHDSHSRFVQQLEQLAHDHQNFQWHPYFVRRDECLFLHGDVLDSDPSHKNLDKQRMTWEREHELGACANWLYDVVVSARLHRMAAHVFQRHKMVLRRIVSYLEAIGHGPENGLRHVYFGHTHRRMADVEYGGLMFHNGGAAIRGLDFRIVPIRGLMSLDD